MKVFIFIVLFGFSLTVFSQSGDRALLDLANKNISAALVKQDFKSAARSAQEAVDISRKVYGERSREVAIAHENLGAVLMQADKHKLAVDQFKAALEIFQSDKTRNAKDIAGVMQKLGESMTLSGQKKEAEELFGRAIVAARDAFGQDSVQYLNAKLGSVCFNRRSRQNVRAFEEFAEIYAIALAKFGPESKELDQVAVACEGSMIMDFWKNEGHANAARKKLNDLLGYQLGKPTKLSNADFSLTLNDIGRPNLNSYEVVMKVWLNESGTPTGSRLVFGRDSFEEMAKSAIRDSKFKASVRANKPIPDVLYVMFSFIR